MSLRGCGGCVVWECMPGEPWVQWCAPKCLTTGSWTSLGVLWLRLCLPIRVGRFDPWLGDPWKTWFSELLDLGIVAFADFCGVNILSMADGKLPTWCLWTLELESAVHNALPGSGVIQFQHTTAWVTMWVWLSWSRHSGETTGRDIYTCLGSLGCLGLPILGVGGSVVKNPPDNARDPGSIPGWGSSPGGENGNPLQFSCLENSMDREAWWATGVKKELDET